MKYLVWLSRHLSEDIPINGYTEEASDRKRVFEIVGKKAMKQLASILGLVEYNISFNRGGMAGSGDLRLMGFNSKEQGIYIMMNKDMRGLEVLYRTVEHMRDFTGGMNNWASFAELETPGVLKQKIESLWEHACCRRKEHLRKKVRHA